MDYSIKAQHRKIKGHISNASSEYVFIICNGFRANWGDLSPRGLMKVIESHGHGIFNFHPNGRLSGMDVKTQAQEVTEIINHFASKDKKIILMGHSLGALVTAIVANKNQNISGLITLNGFFGLRKVYGPLLKYYALFRSLATAKPSYKKIWKFYRSFYKPEVIERPVLVVHSIVDKSVSFDQSLSFFKKLDCQKDFIVLKYSDHMLTVDEEHLSTAEQINIWIKEELA